MTRDELAALRRRFNFACGYCGATETGAGARLTVDHFRPTAQNGAGDIDNWLYSCFACNIFKGAYWSDDEELQLLHPLRDDVSTHIEQRGALLSDYPSAAGITSNDCISIENS
ncbi:MAG TPA: HNH endonuclease signature motif containing protein [Abditibacterium sp.]|jgi:5-methylcytosine-specific restriction endonuclease McrA